MELLEKYLDHPQRDQIIAREMGWTQLLNGERLERRSGCACWRRNRAGGERGAVAEDSSLSRATVSRITAFTGRLLP